MSSKHKSEHLARSAAEQLDVVMCTHLWSGASLVIRGMTLRSEATDIRIKPENVPMHRFIARCRTTGREFEEFWRVDEPPPLDAFARRAQRALGSKNLKPRYSARKSLQPSQESDEWASRPLALYEAMPDVRPNKLADLSREA